LSWNAKRSRNAKRLLNASRLLNAKRLACGANALKWPGPPAAKWPPMPPPKCPPLPPPPKRPPPPPPTLAAAPVGARAAAPSSVAAAASVITLLRCIASLLSWFPLSSPHSQHARTHAGRIAFSRIALFPIVGDRSLICLPVPKLYTDARALPSAIIATMEPVQDERPVMEPMKRKCPVKERPMKVSHMSSPGHVHQQTTRLAGRLRVDCRVEPSRPSSVVCQQRSRQRHPC